MADENESSVAKAAPSKSGPQTKCKGCGELKSNDQFSKQQLKVPKKAKCLVCIQTAHPELAAAAAVQETRSEQSRVQEWQHNASVEQARSRARRKRT